MTYCRNCGAKLEENAVFCSKCGTRVAAQAAGRSERPAAVRRPMSTFTIAGIVVLAVVIVLALVAVPLLLGGFIPVGRVVGSGNVRTQEESYVGFLIVEVGSGFKVEITQANSYSILITADDNLFSYIQVAMTGKTLTIRLEPGLSFQTTALKAEITMPDLQGLWFSGGVNGTASGFVSSHVFDIKLSGGSVLEADGEASELMALCSGGSSLEMSDFAVDNAEIEFSGGSHGTINVSDRLDATLSGGSRLFYIGDPMLGNVSTSGGSTVSKK